MDNEITFEIFQAGQWRTAGSMSLLDAPDAGWKSRAYLGYVVDYALEQAGRRDAAALSWTFPVGFQPLQANTWPGFIMDLLPQGYGRQELLRQLGLPAHVEATADWRLLRSGAANPVGNCRVREAFDWLQERSPLQQQGFSFTEVAHRGEALAEYLAQHGLFVAGSSAVQGEWPKILLTEDANGKLFLDHALPERRADGWVGLTPVFDFAPMLFHPDGIARNMRWEQQDDGHPDWRAAACQAAEAGKVALPSLLAGLRAMADKVLQLPEQMLALGVDEATIQTFAPSIRQAGRKLRECTDG